MANIDTMGITAADLQRRINPRFVADGPHVAAYVESVAVASVNTGTDTITFSGVEWPANGLVGLFVRTATAGQQIESNTATTITVTGSVASLSLAPGVLVDITGWPLFWTADEFTEELGLASAEVLGAVTTAYHRMARRIVGEILVSFATSGATTATFTYAPTGNVELILAIPRPVETFTPGESALPSWVATHVLSNDLPPTYDYTRLGSSDYTLSGRDLTLTTALTAGARLIGSYDHDFGGDNDAVLIPKSLKTWTLNILSHTFHLSRVGDGEINPTVQSLYEQTQAALDKLRDPGDPAGIDELDAIRLLESEETRKEQSATSRKMLISW